MEMSKLEKVIKGLECHRIDNNHRINCADCPYYVDDDNHIRCVNDLHDDALFLLKEQEEMKKPTLVWPVPPERFRNKTTDT